ncbi:MAG: 3-phosphoshikimate 1-carboxyvinyltransferase, partial [Erysipelotrichia bacterium]|nr:3-phosphoshikimate 1-carboxyvinyltransferase [Erysipelotrichia bacterium]
MQIFPAATVGGEIEFRGDKSISHRLVLSSLLLDGVFVLKNLSDCRDVETSIAAVETLGVNILRNAGSACLRATLPFSPLIDRQQTIDCGNSGTTARLLAGILCGRPGRFELTGDASLSNRPMQRIITPLRQMGADIYAENTKTLPILIRGKNLLQPLSFVNSLASAQVKSAILFAALYAKGTTIISEPVASRDHTERLLQFLKLPVERHEQTISLTGPALISGNHEFTIPGDISSAAFFAVAAAIFPGSQILIKNVLLNIGRTAFLKVLKRMGAIINIE